MNPDSKSEPELKSKDKIKQSFNKHLIRLAKALPIVAPAVLLLACGGTEISTINTNPNQISSYSSNSPQFRKEYPEVNYSSPKFLADISQKGPEQVPTTVFKTVTAQEYATVQGNNEEISLPITNNFSEFEKKKSEQAIFSLTFTNPNNQNLEERSTGFKMDYEDDEFYFVATTDHGSLGNNWENSNFSMTQVGLGTEKKVFPVDWVYRDGINDAVILLIPKNDGTKKIFDNMPGYKFKKNDKINVDSPITHMGIPYQAVKDNGSNFDVSLYGKTVDRPQIYFDRTRNIYLILKQAQDHGSSGGPGLEDEEGSNEKVAIGLICSTPDNRELYILKINNLNDEWAKNGINIGKFNATRKTALKSSP